MHSLANALVVVDVQNDFTPGGSLAVPEGDTVATKIKEFINEHCDDYRVIVATKDWHPVGTIERLNDAAFTHFSREPDYKDTWPAHCQRGTVGSDFHPNLNAYAFPSSTMEKAAFDLNGDVVLFDQIFFKGQTSPAYSGFEGVTDPAVFTLDEYLRGHEIGHVDVVGIELRNCVYATAVDSQKFGYDTTVLLDKVASLAPESGAEACQEMIDAGIHVDGWN